MKKWIFILLFVWPIVGCDLVGNNDKSSAPFDAGPILFIYNGQLWSMEEDGSDVKQLTRYEYPDFSVGDARWSPDGSKIAVAGPADPGNLEEWAGAIYIMNADGTGRHKLTTPPLGHFRYLGDLQRKYTWSPDGKSIAFSRMRPPEALGLFDIFVVELATGTESLISEANSLEYVDDWHPDRNELLINYSNYADERVQLGFMNLNGNYTEIIGNPDIRYSQGRISPDGSKVAYSKDNALYVLDFETHQEQLLFDQIDYVAPHVWSPLGDKLIFQNWASSPEHQQVYIINTQTGDVKNIIPFPSPETWIWVSSWR